MKNLTTTICLFFFLSAALLQAQTPLDFNRKDCNGVQRHLFGDLAAGNVVIIEFFMANCAPCPVAAQHIQTMKNSLLTQYPGKVMSYAMAYTNAYATTTVINWVNAYAPGAIPMDSGAVQVAHYGGMGMPTVVILGGKTTHSVLGSPYMGFSSIDTVQALADMRAYFAATTNTGSTVGLKENKETISGLNIFPSPAFHEISVTFNVKQRSEVTVSLFDITGKMIAILDNRIVGEQYSKTLSLPEVGAGNYFVRIDSSDGTVSQKIIIQ